MNAFVQAIQNGAWAHLDDAAIAREHWRRALKAHVRYLRQGLHECSERARLNAIFWNKRRKEHIVAALGCRRDARELRNSPELLSLVDASAANSNAALAVAADHD